MNEINPVQASLPPVLRMFYSGEMERRTWTEDGKEQVLRARRERPFHPQQLEELVEEFSEKKYLSEKIRATKIHINRWDYADFRIWSREIGSLKHWEKGPDMACMGSIWGDVEVLVYKDMSERQIYIEVENTSGVSRIIGLTMT